MKRLLKKIAKSLRRNPFLDGIATRILAIIRKRSRISRTAILTFRNLIRIGNNVDIGEYVIIRTAEKFVEIGDNSQLNPFTVIYGGAGVTIGKNVMIAPHVMIAAGQHEFRNLVKPMRFSGDFSKGPIFIEDDVWIGANAVILDGVKIKKGAIVAAGAVVTSDVGEYDIAAGVPARRISNRRSYSNR